jgi:hypothetical protein
MNRQYAYLYDDFLAAPTHHKALAAVETKLGALGVHGKVNRLAIFRSAREMVEGMVKGGAETIVIVGNDATLQKLMWFLPDLPITVGYIPVCPPNTIAALLGIPMGEDACEVIAARRVETLDLGRLDDRYFLTEVRVERTKAGIEIDGRFRISPAHGGTISVRNLGSLTADGNVSADARDGFLEAVVEPALIPTEPSRFRLRSPKRMEATRMTFTKGAIVSDEPCDVFVDGQRMNGFHYALSIVPHKLRMIVGRGRG